MLHVEVLIAQLQELLGCDRVVGQLAFGLRRVDDLELLPELRRRLHLISVCAWIFAWNCFSSGVMVRSPSGAAAGAGAAAGVAGVDSAVAPLTSAVPAPASV